MQMRFEFAPQSNAFEQGTRLIHPGLAVGQGGVHVEMRVHKRRCQQPTAAVHHLMRRRIQSLLNGHDAPGLHAHVDLGSTIGQVTMLQQQIQHASRLH